MYIGVKKYIEFQFKLNQGKKLTKRVKILQKIENFVSDFCRPKNLFIFMFILSCFTWRRVIVSRVGYIIQLLFTGSKSTISVFIVNFEHNALHNTVFNIQNCMCSTFAFSFLYDRFFI